MKKDYDKLLLGWLIVDMKNKHNLTNEKGASEFFDVQNKQMIVMMCLRLAKSGY